MFSSLLHSYWPINCLYTCLSVANLLLLYRRSQSAAGHRFGWNNKSWNVSRVFFILVQDNKIEV